MLVDHGAKHMENQSEMNHLKVQSWFSIWGRWPSSKRDASPIFIGPKNYPSPNQKKQMQIM